MTRGRKIPRDIDFEQGNCEKNGLGDRYQTRLYHEEMCFGAHGNFYGEEQSGRRIVCSCRPRKEGAATWLNVSLTQKREKGR